MSVRQGEEKVRKICDILQEQTLGPAREQAKEIVEKANEQAREIIEQGKREAGRCEEEARRKIDEGRKIFEASIGVACSKAFDELRAEVKDKLFDEGLASLVGDSMRDTGLVMQLIKAVGQAIAQKGLYADLVLEVGKELEVEKLTQEIAKLAIGKLTFQEIQIGNFDRGVKIKLIEGRITIDMSEQALKNLVARMVGEQFQSVVLNLNS